MNNRDRRKLALRIFHSFRGLDALQPLIDDPDITEIMINRHDVIFIEKEGEITHAPVVFDSQEKLENIIQTVVGRVNRVVNESSPMVDARLPDGSRVHVVLPPISLDGPVMTIRKFPPRPMTMDDLIARGAISREAAEFLGRCVRSKYNVFISGGTGSGKTTFVNALSQFIPAEERIITIEDSAELQLVTLPNVVRLETRNANMEGRGKIDMSDLIRAALRMRPNRIIVGEVRGPEAADMLQAMNTGHDGSLSTGHANSCRDMLSRLETMVLSGSRVPLEVIRQQIASAIEIMVHLGRLRDRSRRVLEICELAGYENGDYELNPLYVSEDQPHPEQEGRSRHALVSTGRDLIKARKWTMAGFGVPAADSAGKGG
jgi:pilus assembly protein CpaF